MKAGFYYYTITASQAVQFTTNGITREPNGMNASVSAKSTFSAFSNIAFCEEGKEPELDDHMMRVAIEKLPPQMGWMDHHVQRHDGTKFLMESLPLVLSVDEVTEILEQVSAK